VSTAFTTPASWWGLCMSKHKRGRSSKRAPLVTHGRNSGPQGLPHKVYKIAPARRLGFRSWRLKPPAISRAFPTLADGPESTMLRCTDRDQAIEDQVGYFVFAELWMRMRDAVRGNERDDVGVDAESGAFLGNVVGYD
jgi:hypothetical protein